MFLSALILSFTLVGFSQDDKLPCNDLPYATPEHKAKYDGDIEKYFSDDLSAEMKKGTVSGTFRMYVDCYGEVTKAGFQSGEMKDSDQKKMIDLIYKMKWKPAQVKGKDVTSSVFIVLEIVNGQVAVKVY